MASYQIPHPPFDPAMPAETPIDTNIDLNGHFENSSELARQLIRHLGIEGATRTCRENHWDGVLSEVQAQTKN